MLQPAAAAVPQRMAQQPAPWRWRQPTAAGGSIKPLGERQATSFQVNQAQWHSSFFFQPVKYSQSPP